MDGRGKAEVHKVHKDVIFFRQKQGYCDKILKENAEIGKVVSAGKAFLQTLKDLDCDRFNGITITTFQKAFEKVIN